MTTQNVQTPTNRVAAATVYGEERYVGDNEDTITGTVAGNDSNVSKYYLSAAPGIGRLVFPGDGSYVYKMDAVRMRVTGVEAGFRYHGVNSLGAYNIVNNCTHPNYCWGRQFAVAEFTHIKPLLIPECHSFVSPKSRGIVPRADMQVNPGCYLHWNIDNDNLNVDSSKSVTDPEYSIKDYTEKTAAVTGEDDLKTLNIAVAGGIPAVGKMVLHRENDRVCIWKANIKGSGNELSFSGSKIEWDLSVPAQRQAFIDLEQTELWVEGCWHESTELSLWYEAPNGAITEDVVKYKFFAATAGRQPSPAERAQIEGEFPNIVHAEWSITDEVTPPPFLQGYDPNRFYNCYAYPVGDLHIFWDPVRSSTGYPQQGYRGIDNDFGAPRPDGEFQSRDLSNFFFKYRNLAWKPYGHITDAKAVSYSRFWAGQVQITHAAKNFRDFADGKLDMFESKLGNLLRIEHVDNQLDGSEEYGNRHLWYR